MSEPLLTFQQLSLQIGQKIILDHLSFSLDEGKILVIAGKSGSGKSTLLKAAGGLLPENIQTVSGHITWNGQRLYQKASWQPLRRGGISFIFQDALSSFCPVVRVDEQLWQACRAAGLCRGEFERLLRDRAKSLDLSPASLHLYPQELSGGMIQRAELLFPLLLPPRLVLADEPTSAVDSLTQQKIAQALLRLRRYHHTAILLVTHDLRLAAALADSLLILKDGTRQEYGPAPQVLSQPQSAYTQKLLRRSGLKGENTCS